MNGNCHCRRLSEWLPGVFEGPSVRLALPVEVRTGLAVLRAHQILRIHDANCEAPLSTRHAEAADVLVCADLRGIDSHGVARQHTYFELLNERRINPRPQLKVIRSTPSTANVDGDNGLGLVIGPHANRIAMVCGSDFSSID